MRRPRRRTAAAAGALMITAALAGAASAQAPVTAPATRPALPVPDAFPGPHTDGARRGASAPARTAAGRRAAVRAQTAAAGTGSGRRRFQASCRTAVSGSHTTVYCHNPYPVTDRIRLHVECARWWDVDADSAAYALGPAGYVRLTDRCWKEIARVWVSHEPSGGASRAG
jgi:hypothetical protein